MEATEVMPFLSGYFANPRPGRVSELFALIERERLLDRTDLQGGIAGVVLALFEKHPEHELDWARFSMLRAAAKTRRAELRQANRPGLNDYLMARWFVLHDEAAVLELIERQEIPGGVGESASWMLESVANGDPALVRVLQKMEASGLMRTGE